MFCSSGSANGGRLALQASASAQRCRGGGWAWRSHATRFKRPSSYVRCGFRCLATQQAIKRITRRRAFADVAMNKRFVLPAVMFLSIVVASRRAFRCLICASLFLNTVGQGNESNDDAVCDAKCADARPTQLATDGERMDKDGSRSRVELRPIVEKQLHGHGAGR